MCVAAASLGSAAHIPTRCYSASTLPRPIGQTRIAMPLVRVDCVPKGRSRRRATGTSSTSKRPKRHYLLLFKASLDGLKDDKVNGVSEGELKLGCWFGMWPPDFWMLSWTMAVIQSRPDRPSCVFVLTGSPLGTACRCPCTRSRAGGVTVSFRACSVGSGQRKARHGPLIGTFVRAHLRAHNHRQVGPR